MGLIAHVRDCNLRSFTVSFQTLLPLLRVLRDRTVPSEDSHRLLLAMKVMNSHMRLIRAGAPKIFHKDDASSGLPDHRHQAYLKEKTYHKKIIHFLATDAAPVPHAKSLLLSLTKVMQLKVAKLGRVN